MKWVADESVDRPIVERLRADGHEVWYVAEAQPGIPDQDVLRHANEQGATLLTADKDFGELVFRRRLISNGVLLLRLAGLSNDTKAEIVSGIVRQHASELPACFTVAAPGLLRIRKGFWGID
jgi:predicted nuclease of predicted toxin-antitoxin system